MSNYICIHMLGLPAASFRFLWWRVPKQLLLEKIDCSNLAANTTIECFSLSHILISMAIPTSTKGVQPNVPRAIHWRSRAFGWRQEPLRKCVFKHMVKKNMYRTWQVQGITMVKMSGLRKLGCISCLTAAKLST